MNEIITHEITVNNWTLTKIENQPEEIFVDDLFLAKQLQYKRPVDIRKLIKRMIDGGDLKPSEVYAKLTQTTAKGGRPGQSYFLSESGALKVSAHSETPMGKKLLDEVINVFLMAKRGQLTPPQQIPTQDISILTGAVAALTKAVEGLLAAQQAQQAPAPQLPVKAQIQPAQQPPLQPDLIKPSRDLRWYQVFDVCRELNINVGRFWELWRAARCSNWQRRQQVSGRWTIREDAYAMICAVAEYR